MNFCIYVDHKIRHKTESTCPQCQFHCGSLCEWKGVNCNANTHTHTHTHAHTHSRTHSLSLSLSHTHTHSRTHTLSLSHTHEHSLSLSHSHTHTQTHTHTHRNKHVQLHSVYSDRQSSKRTLTYVPCRPGYLWSSPQVHGLSADPPPGYERWWTAHLLPGRYAACCIIEVSHFRMSHWHVAT